MSTLTKCLISMAIGMAIGVSPLRDSLIVRILVAITGGE